MDGLNSSILTGTVISLSGRIIGLCWDYFSQVKSARAEIERLRKEVLIFQENAKKLQELSQGPEKEKLALSGNVVESLKQCEEDLKSLEKRLQPSKLRKYGIGALKWPLASKDIDKIIQALKRHELSFNTILNLGQMNAVLQLDQRIGRIEQEHYLAMLPCAKGARFDSYTWQHEPFCHQDTRIELLKEIQRWADDPNDKCVYWLNGMAGTGKSTIARTFAKQLQNEGHFCGTFFFSRGNGELANAEKLWSTLAVSLANASPLLLNYVSEAIMANSAIGYQGLREQWKHLIFGPLRRVDDTCQERVTFILVIDALDECENEEDVTVVLELLSMIQSFRIARLRAFITSRPELHIRLGFSEMPHIVYRDLLLHDIDRSVVSHDIRVYLNDEMSKIGIRRRTAVDWPGENAISVLVERADCLFIYAATACRYVGESSRISPETRLRNLLTIGSSDYTAEKSLDKMYLHILNNSLSVEYSEQELVSLSEQFQFIVGTIVLLNEPLSVKPLSKLLAAHLAKYITGDDTVENLIHITLDPFASLLNISSTPTTPIRILHPSVRDFLTNPNRCTNQHFRVSPGRMHAEICDACLNVINSSLKVDICNIQEIGILYSNIDGNKVQRVIPAHVQYACRYWIRHFISSAHLVDEIEGVSRFFETNILKWLETILLLRHLGDIISDLFTLNQRCKGRSPGSSTFTLKIRSSGEMIQIDFDKIIFDLLIFLTSHRSTIENAPYQLYVSALLQSPQDSFVRRLYKDDVPSWVDTPPLMEKTWSASTQYFEAHSDDILDLMASSNGRLLVSGSKDGMVKIWNLHKGALETSLLGHKAAVQSIAISSTSAMVASASKDTTARIWSVKTGACLHVLEGHTDALQKVVISPDSSVIATGCSDGCIRLWNPSSGIQLANLESNAGAVTDLAFSGDGKYLAAGYYDGSLCFWSLASYSLISMLHDHKSAVNSIVFSNGPRGHIVASGSYDRTIKIWSVPAGELLATFVGHTRLVKSITISCSGTWLASASFDNTVKVWEIASGRLMSTLEGHKDALLKVAFSENSENVLASAGKDRTLKIWDVTKNGPLATFKGHSRSINVITWVQQDGGQELIASASRDCTIRVWDPFSERTVDTSLKSHNDVVSGIELSPDAKLLATRSKDKSVRLWNVSDGEMLHAYECHTDWVSALVFSPNSQMIASGAHDHNIFLYNVDGRTLAKMSGHSRAILALQFSSNNKKIASIAYDRSVKVWNPDGQMLASFNNHTRKVNSIQFSSDCVRLVSASYDCTIGVYNIESCRSEQTLRGHIRSVDSVCFSSDGRNIASGSKDQTVKIWDTMSGQLKMTLRGHTENVSTVLFSPDGNKIISRADTTVNIWDTGSSSLLTVLNDVSPFALDTGTSAVWSPDGFMTVKQLAPGQSENQLSYRYARKFLHLSSSSSEGAGPQSRALSFQPDKNDVKFEGESHFAVNPNLQWITYNGENVLFLPGHLRPSVFVINRDTVVLGNGNGKVCLYNFNSSEFRKSGNTTFS